MEHVQTGGSRSTQIQDYYTVDKQMNVSEDLEKDLDSRGYKYLDDEGSISPIEESA